MTDGYIQHQPDSTGKKVDADTVTQYDGTLVYRQRATIDDDDLLNRLDQMILLLTAIKTGLDILNNQEVVL